MAPAAIEAGEPAVVLHVKHAVPVEREPPDEGAVELAGSIAVPADARPTTR